MNIYLDIDGVIVSNTEDKAANYAKEFLEYVLSNYPDSTYWLTTHCQGDAERPINNIKHLFDEETVELMKRIQPTIWMESSKKTDAIDFAKPFLWFDDNLFYGDRQVLAENGVLENWIEVNLRKDPNQLGEFLQSFPIPINQLCKESDTKRHSRAEKNVSVALEKDRYMGALFGLAIGDALGAHAENLKRDSFTVEDMPSQLIDDIVPGYFTDDTSMALCLADSLIVSRGWNANDQMYRYLRWIDQGYLSPFGYAYGVGATTFDSINRFIDSDGKEPYAGATDPGTAGNGSLMRLAPVPMLYRLNVNLVEKYCGLSSKTTHKTPEAVDACRFYGLLIAGALNGKTKEEILDSGFANIRDLSPAIKAIANGSYKTISRDKVLSSGYVVHSLEASLWCFYNTDSYEEGVLAAVNLGGDSDTTAAIYGQLAGSYYGYESIPKKWRNLIAMKDTIRDISLGLCKLSQSYHLSEEDISKMVF